MDKVTITDYVLIGQSDLFKIVKSDFNNFLKKVNIPSYTFNFKRIDNTLFLSLPKNIYDGNLFSIKHTSDEVVLDAIGNGIEYFDFVKLNGAELNKYYDALIAFLELEIKK